MTVRLTGSMTVAARDLPAVRAALPEHVRLTLAEPGCRSFGASEQADGVFEVAEVFDDEAAFEAHQARIPGTAWAAVTKEARRDYQVSHD